MWTPEETDFEAWGLLRREPWADCDYATPAWVEDIIQDTGFREHTEADAREDMTPERQARAEAVGRGVMRMTQRDMAIAIAYYGAFPGASGRPQHDCRRISIRPKLDFEECRSEIPRVRRLVCAAVELASAA